MFNRCVNESCDLMRFVCQEYFSTIRHQNSKVLWVNVVFQILNILTASTGNLLVLVTIWRTPYLNRPSHTLLFSLALSDFCTGTIAQPITIHTEILILTSTSTVSCILRTTCVFLNIFWGVVTLLMITMISVDKFLAINLHLRYNEIVTNPRAKIIGLVIWMVGGAISLVSLSSVLFIQWSLIITGTLCFVAMFLIWINIFRVVRRHRAQIQQQILRIADDQPFNMLRFRKTAHGCILLLILFLVCYFPQVVLLLRMLSKTNVEHNFIGFYLSYTLMVINASLNPVVYCWRNNDIRSALKQILLKLVCR
ncbi:PREDICTED: melanocyte-stimulating hormone receptor-like [Acropora digitifera]|uniref:melanocyte-stimulating hormone receptor-like n=1 Tax=Acropora digitifera TaxID=70779 RepID=UPI00077A0646|nr:PREDICTED: melanocyte-stimulating hormone receptor-like [Acropora digitifera]